MVMLLLLIFWKEINLLIQISNIMDGNTESRVLKTLDDDLTSMLVAKMIDSRPTHLIIQQRLKCLRFQICSILMNKI